MDMEQMKKMLKRKLKGIFCLPPVPTLLIAVPAYGLVIYALTGENVEPAAAYAAYLLSAYAFILTVTGVVGAARFARHNIGEHPLVRKALDIPAFSL